MPAYPTTPVFSYPLTRSLVFQTRIHAGQDGTEQRTQLSTGEERWALSYPSLTLTVMQTLLTFFEGELGSAKQDITFTFDGVEYTNCHIDEDTFSAVESHNGRFAVSLAVVQAVRASDAGALPADFPVLSTGARMQLPYTHSRKFDTAVVRTEGGRYTYSKRAAAQKSWSVGGTVLTATEAQAIWDQFRLARGMWAEFAFTDPDTATRYARCRFGSDTLEWRYTGYNVNAVESTIVQVA
jgi:hypothetical protein